MIGKLNQYEVSWGKLKLNPEDIYLSMGVGYIPDEEILKRLEVLKSEIITRCHPRYVFASFKASPARENHVKAGEIELHTGAVITPYLKDANQYILFVATAGQEFEGFQQEVKVSSDILQEFLLDSLGSAIAEAVVREVCGTVEEYFLPLRYGVSHPYSPGYCGWHVTQQRLIFSLLPEHPCGVSLNGASLMSPIKSVSGIIAVGEKIIKRKYGCELCGKDDCYKNINKIKNRLL